MAGARRLDWRFLLPMPPGGFDHLILLGGDPALRVLAAELGIARRVSASLTEGDAPDLVVVLHGASVDPRRVAAVLRPGGAWYWEIDRRRSFGLPTSTAARLARAGLGASSAYWVPGGFTVPRRFVPLDRDEALAWYFATIFRHHSVGRRALRAGLRVLTGWQGRRFARLLRHYALVGARGQPPGVLRTIGSDHVGDDPRPLVLLGGEGEWSRVTFIPFSREGSRPTIVIKVVRRVAFTRRTAQEQRILRELCSRSSPLSHSIPRALGFFDWQGLGVGVESCAAGKPLFGEAQSSLTRAARLAEAGAWLAALHAGTERGRLCGAVLRERIVGAPLTEYESVFGTQGGEAGLFALARRHAERSEGVELPIVLEHGDFGPWNVFHDGRGISVVDWEAARDGPPLCDLLYFVVHWTNRSRGTAMPKAARRLTLPLSAPRRNWLDEITRREIVRYVRRLGVPERLYPLLLVYTFVEQALDRAARLREQGAASASDRSANPYVACVSALARDADRLFQEGP